MSPEDDYNEAVQKLHRHVDRSIKAIVRLTDATVDYVRAYRDLAIDDQAGAQANRDEVVMARRTAIEVLKASVEDANDIRDDFPILAARLKFAAQRAITEIESY